MGDDEKLIFCSFCGKESEYVKKVIASKKAYICNECVELCVEILVSQNVSLRLSIPCGG